MNGLILMTALPPTRGHLYLIEFASRYLAKADPNGVVAVILFSRDREPIKGADRLAALKEAAVDLPNVAFRHHHGEVPQDPSEHPMFWEVWHGIVARHIDLTQPGIVFASDLYGKDMAAAIGWRFLPCNTYREVVDISATRIRHDPFTHFASILPTFQPQLRRTVTFFGAESTGKSTLSRLMATNHNGYWVPEWAREYMEVMGLTEISDQLMLDVTHAQYASQKAVQRMLDRPFVMQDTDLLTTIGYYRIWGKREPMITRRLFEDSRSDLYILMNDMIPFTPDRLRLGGDRRESTNAFWIDLLKEFDCDYHIVHSTYRERQEEEVSTVIRNDFLNNADGLGMFLRVNQERAA